MGLVGVEGHWRRRRASALLDATIQSAWRPLQNSLVIGGNRGGGEGEGVEREREREREIQNRIRNGLIFDRFEGRWWNGNEDVELGRRGSGLHIRSVLYSTASWFFTCYVPTWTMTQSVFKFLPLPLPRPLPPLPYPTDEIKADV